MTSTSPPSYSAERWATDRWVYFRQHDGTSRHNSTKKIEAAATPEPPWY